MKGMFPQNPMNPDTVTPTDITAKAAAIADKLLTLGELSPEDLDVIETTIDNKIASTRQRGVAAAKEELRATIEAADPGTVDKIKKAIAALK